MRSLFFYYILVIMQDKSLRLVHKDEYCAWRNMRQRCLNLNVPNYHRYGGRGIKICSEWDSFETFLEDMGLKPSSDRSLERRDNNGNYEPSNCYWALRDEQENNKERSVKLTYKGETFTLTQWARKLNMSYEQVRTRYRYGWEPEDIFEAPKNKYRKPRKHGNRSKLITYNGETLTVTEWAKKLGVDYEIIRSRLRYGWTPEKILTTPILKRNR